MRAKVTVEAIHQAALQVLGDVGWAKLTTTRVAIRAGVSVGTFYQYYDGKDALARALVVAYVGRIEQAMKTVLAEDSSLPTLARHFVRRFVAFKLQGTPGDEALKAVYQREQCQAVANKATAALIITLAARLRAGKPAWPESRVLEVASMWPALVFGTTIAMVDRQHEILAEPWFSDSLERALLALLR